MDSIYSFIQFQAEPQDIRNVHKFIVPDTELANFADEYSDIKTMLAQNKKPKFAREVFQDLCRAAQSNREVSPNSMVLAINRVNLLLRSVNALKVN